jgi:hypothetical protein
MSDNNLNTEKKKRGRKPKPKVENEEPKIPKKRGRKPKLKLISEEEKNKFILPSKRGRKPKDKTIVLNKDLNLDNISNVILHLPISLDKLNELDEELSFKYEKKNILPDPFDPTISTDYNVNKKETSCIYKIIDNNEKILETEIENSINSINYNTHLYNDTNYKNIKCNWCLHDCEDKVTHLPFNISNGVFNMYGNFCCPECAAAFNFNELNDDLIWERYSLLNYVYNENNSKYNIAPSRLILDIFGGPLSIKEFREIINTNKNINTILPPLYIIKPQIEITKNEDIYIPLNINRVNKYTKDLKLKKKNDIPLANTLNSCMNLKF